MRRIYSRHSLYLALALILMLYLSVGISQVIGKQSRQIRPAWSPTGNCYAYLSDESGLFQLYLHDLEANKTRQITDSEVAIQQFKWSPGGDQIAYLSEEGLTIIRADGSGSMHLNTRLNLPVFFQWTPEGRAMTYSCTIEDKVSDICLKSLFEHFDINLTEDDAPNRNFSWSPDGTKLAFGSERGGRLDIFLLKVSNDELQRITDLPHNAVDPVFSPKGDVLTFLYDRDGQHQHFDVYGYELTTGSLKPIYTGEGYNLPLWFPDNQHLLINSNSNGRWAFYRVSRDGTDRKKLGNGLAYSIHPDGYRVLVQSGAAGAERIEIVVLE